MAENKYIAVAYQLYVKDEEDEQEALTEQCDEQHPFQFISNLGCVLPAFEKALEDKATGDNFDFVIPCAEAYGEFKDEMMFDVPKHVFEINGRFDSEHIFEGNIIPLQGEDGSRFNATVIEVKAEAVTIDLNHPRAGEDLHFVGKVVELRPATNDEITGMVNMLSGEGGCNCGCGGHCGEEGCGGCGEHHHDEGCGCGHCH